MAGPLGFMDRGPSAPISRGTRAPPPGTELGGRYTLRRFIGSGAIGSVYEATDQNGTRVAVKLLLGLLTSARADELAARFEREAEVSRAIDNEHVVPVVDAGVDEELYVPYLVMPMLCGFDLDALLDRTGALHPTVAVRIACQVAAGLSAAHELGVVHRDVKPGNLFLEHRRDGSVVVRLLDFGMAKLTGAEQNITGEGSLLGTPHYMAPEQSKSSKDVDARADVWGLGATLYHALSGASPYRELRRFIDLLLALNTKPFTPLQERAPWIDPALAELVHGALLKDRDHRCPSVRALGSALWQFAGESVELDAAMLEPAPAAITRSIAAAASLPERWSPGAPREPVPLLATTREPRIGTTLGRWVLERRLTRRSGRDVYQARDERGEPVAIEVLTTPLAADHAMLERLTTLDDPHVVAVKEAALGPPGRDAPHLVVELLHGTTLRRILTRHTSIEPHAAVAIGIQAARGLQALHDASIHHGAVRPDSLFLAEQPDGSLRVRLTGFSFLQAHADDAEPATYRYRAPEQPRKGTSARADVFGLGATLFHALSGALPPGHVQDGAPWLRRELAEIIHRSLDPDPAHRPPSAADLADALQAHALVSNIRLHDLGPVPQEMRVRVEDRAEPVPVVAPTASRVWLVLLAVVIGGALLWWLAR